jgi:4-hydroxy-tetrahydrodipicolinate synthase
MSYDRLFVATMTPYVDGSFEIDEDQFRSILRSFTAPRYLEAGMALIINPEASEVFYLSREEKQRNVEIAIDEVGGKTLIFAGLMGNRTEEVVEAADDAREAGAEGFFMLPPIGALDITTSWNASEYPEVWGDVIRAVVAAHPEMPVICHPTATPTPAFGIGLPLVPTLNLCREIENIVGWKMTYNYDGYRTVAAGLRSLDRHVAVLGAPATYFHENLANEQFDGTACGAFGYALEPMVAHIEAWRREDLKEARRIWEGGLAALQEYVYRDNSRLHLRYKVASWLAGEMSNPWMRPPLPRPRSEEIETLYGLLQGVGVDVISREEVDAVEQTRPSQVLALR